MHGPDPNTPYPFNGEPHTIFLKNFITRPTIEVGDYTYYNDLQSPEEFENKCVQYHFDFIGDRLIIGRFCAIATGIMFVMNGANHAMTGLSTYPFNIFQNGWEADFDIDTITAGLRGDTLVGNDVWIGRDARIMPGITIGDGAIIGANAVVATDVPPYAVVAGNPAQIVRMRFPDEIVGQLIDISWWFWSAEKIARNLHAIRGQDVEALKVAA
ncbi:MAG: CatB-related O-acetyltransferase [Stappiaceae bacterium]